MSTDQIINIVKTVKSPPVDFLMQHLVSGVKYADPAAHNAFFAASEPAGAQAIADVASSLQEFAVKYLSFVLSTNTAYGFNATIQNADTNLINNWFLQNTNTVGQRLFMDYLQQPTMLGDYFKDPATWATALSAKLGSNDFLTGLLVECDTIGSMLPPKVLLLLLQALDNDGPNFKHVLQAWVVNPRWRDLEGYDTYPWLSVVAPSFAQNGPAFNVINQAVNKACTDHDPPYHYTEHHYTAFKGENIDDPTDYLITTYGPTVVAWLANPNGPRKYGLRSAAAPNNVTTVQTSQNGCVRAGTPILMADGSIKPVEQIVEGDTIFSGGGTVSVCSSELVVNDHVTHLYSINDDEPFMSFEHAVMTQRGWCSLAPRMTMELTPHYSIKHLTKGDVVWKVSGIAHGRVTYDKVVVERINTRILEPGEAVVGFDLHLRSGQPSYHANGYCCLVSYPEITAQRITSNVLSEMSLAERLEFDKQLEAMSPLLEKALGAPLMTVVKQALIKPHLVAARGKHTSPQGRKRRHLRGAANMLVPRLDVTLHTETQTGAAPMSSLALVNGQLFIDGAAVRTHCQENHVFWHRRLSNDVNEHGAIRLLSHGLLGSGVVRRGDQLVSFTANGMVDYHMTYGQHKTAWYDVQITPRKDANGGWIFSGGLSDPTDASKNADLAKYARVVFSLAQNSQSQTVLHATITFDASYCAFGGSSWIAAEIDFTLDYRFCTGSLYPYDSAQPAYRGPAQALSGECADLAAIRNLQQRLTAQMVKRPIQRGYLATSNREGIVAASVRPALALASAIPLSVNQLFDSEPPDMTNLHELSFGKLKNLMLLALGQENTTYLSWFGETMPSVGPGAALSQPEADLTNDSQIKRFLVDQFAIGYLTQAFSKSTDDNIKQKFAAIPNVDAKLSYFWKGDGTTSFAQSKGYSAATTKLMDSSYAEVVPFLADYLSGNPTNWAKQLYDHCTDPTILTQLALQNSLDGQKRITHLCTMLHVLDPVARIVKPNGKSVSYATSLYERVINVGVNEVIKLSHLANQTDMVEFLTEYFRAYFNSLLEGGKWDDAIRNQALKELNELMQQYEVDNVNAMVAQLGSFIADSVVLLTTVKPLGPAIQDWINSTTLAEKYPRLGAFLAKSGSLLPAGMAIGVYGYGLYRAISALFDWKDLAPETKTQTILTICDITFSIFNDVAKFQAARTLAKLNASPDDLVRANDIVRDTFAPDMQVPLKTADSLAGVDPLAGDVEGFDAPGLLGCGSAAAGAPDLATAATRWEKIAAVTEVAAKFMTVLALAGACVGGGFQIANDFETGQPWYIDTLDIISEVANGVATIVEGIGLVVGDFIPIVGVIAAVVGILVSFISMFIHRNPPPTPEETFVDERCVPFINGLDMPSADWLAKQAQAEKQPGLLLAAAFA